MGPVDVPEIFFLCEEMLFKSCNLLEVLHETKKRDCLQSFTQTHLVSEDTVDVVVIQPYHPVQTTNLIIPHFATLDREKYRITSHQKYIITETYLDVCGAFVECDRLG